MSEIKFIGMEKLFLDQFINKPNEEKQFTENYPHIFIPDFSRIKESRTEDIFNEFHERSISYNDMLFLIQQNMKGINANYESMSERYYDPKHKEVFEDKLDEQSNDDGENDFSTSPNISTLKTGYEKFIKTFDISDIYFGFEIVDNYQKNFEKFSEQFFLTNLFSFFEEILKQFSYSTSICIDKFNAMKKLINPNTLNPEVDKMLDDSWVENLEKLKNNTSYNLPTYRLHAKLIDKNCNINIIENFVKKNKIRNFSKIRNSLVHSRKFDFRENMGNLTNMDCFYIIKDLLSLLNKNERIMKRCVYIREITDPYNSIPFL